MVEYVLKKDKFTKVMRRSIRISIITLLIPVAIYFALTSGETLEIFGFLEFLFALMFLYYLVKAIRNLLKVRKDWITFRIVLSEQLLIKNKKKCRIRSCI